MSDEPEGTLQQMDRAAEEASKELLANLDHWSARAVAGWWAKWYLKAGHKRLGRSLVDVAKKHPERRS